VETPQYPAELDLPTPGRARTERARLIANLRTAAAMLESAGTTLPEVLSVGVTAEEITVQPWLPGAPVTAMRAFEALMDGIISRQGYPNPLADGGRLSILATTGTVQGAQVTVTASTYRDVPVDARLGISEQAMAALEAEEEPHAAVLDDRILGELLAATRRVVDNETKEDLDRAEPEHRDTAGAGDGGPESPAEG
jgi:hypothetical protein